MIGDTDLTVLVYKNLGAFFDGDNPTGINLRNDNDGIILYRAIKDAHAAARSEDRTAEKQLGIDSAGNSADEAVKKPSLKWQQVHDLCYDALATKTKDIQLFSFLLEASIRIHNIRALAEILISFKTVLLEGFENLFSVDDESYADRVIPIAGLSGSISSEGTLIKPLRLVSLLPNEVYGRLNLWSLDQANKNNDSEELNAFKEAFSNVSPEDFSDYQKAVDEALSSINEIDSHLTAICGADAPSLRQLREILEDLQRAYRELSVYVASVVPSEENIEGDINKTANKSVTIIKEKKAIETREEAFKLLLQIAKFFKQTEPHSTIPMTLETLVRRGRMDFIDLIGELVPDDHQRREILTRAGIDPSVNNSA